MQWWRHTNLNYKLYFEWPAWWFHNIPTDERASTLTWRCIKPYGPLSPPDHVVWWSTPWWVVISHSYVKIAEVPKNRWFHHVSSLIFLKLGRGSKTASHCSRFWVHTQPPPHVGAQVSDVVVGGPSDGLTHFSCCPLVISQFAIDNYLLGMVILHSFVSLLEVRHHYDLSDILISPYHCWKAAHQFPWNPIETRSLWKSLNIKIATTSVVKTIINQPFGNGWNPTYLWWWLGDGLLLF